MKVRRNLHLVTAEGATARTETYKGREYLVVPVVALVEGVIWPINAESPEYVTPDSYSIAPETWNGRPVFAGHPEREGLNVLGNVPSILETEQFGIVFNAGVIDNKLTMEAWINKEDAEAVGDSAIEIYERAASGKPIEISVGAIVLMEDVKGSYLGQEYDGKWVEVFSDHLALLPAGDVGACSIAMGCGVRTATVHLITAKGYELVSQKEDALPKEAVAKPKKSTPSFMQRLRGVLRTASPAGWSDTEVRSELMEALEAKEPRLKYNGWVVDVFDNESIVIYCVYDEDYDMDLYSRGYRWEGEVAVVDDTAMEVEAVTVYQPAPENNDEIQAQRLARAMGKKIVELTAAPCGCGGTKTTATSATAATSQGDSMKTREERITAMIAASTALVAANKKGPVYAETDRTWLTSVPDAHFASLEAGVKEEEPAATPVKKDEPTPTATTTTPELTEEQFMKAAPASLKRTLARAQQQEVARRSFLTTRLKTAQSEYTEAQLNAMDIDEVERLARMLKVNGPVEAADYSGIAVPRDAAVNEGAPAPPDMNAAIRTAHASKK